MRDAGRLEFDQRRLRPLDLSIHFLVIAPHLSSFANPGNQWRPNFYPLYADARRWPRLARHVGRQLCYSEHDDPF